MDIGYIGLGKMGSGMVLRLLERGHRVVATDVNPELVTHIASRGGTPAHSIKELVGMLSPKRVIWIMVPHQFVDGVLDELLPLLKSNDIIIDGGNSFFEDTVRRHAMCAQKYVWLLDVGTSGGPSGARSGACMMVGGDKQVFLTIEPLLKELTVEGGCLYVGAPGAGHFVKMAHNGIEYGMMQAIAEGFAIMKASPYHIRLEDVAALFGHGSVVESRLMRWLLSGYQQYGESLGGISGEVANSGMGARAVDTAKKYSVETPVILESLNFRIASQGNPSYTGKLVSVMRNQFGGHEADKKE